MDGQKNKKRKGRVTERKREKYYYEDEEESIALVN